MAQFWFRCWRKRSQDTRELLSRSTTSSMWSADRGVVAQIAGPQGARLEVRVEISVVLGAKGR